MTSNIGDQYEKFLIAGATGKTGIELVNLLLKKGKKVAIISRNITKAKTIFKDQYEKFYKVVDYELGNIQLRGDQEIYINNELLEAVEWCDVLISSLGPTMGNDSSRCDYQSNVELINHCEKSKNNFQGKLFIYVSTIYITRPYNFVSFILNYIMPFLMGWKALAENRLRQSNLNYFIVRPGALIDETNINSVIIDQGDKINGRTSRRNLATFILNSLNDPSINTNRSTVEIIDSKISNESFTINLKSPIKSDDKNYLITEDHFTATRNIIIFIYTLIFILILYLICKFK
jgi:hypothetical protein